jgi:hypothetical protein
MGKAAALIASAAMLLSAPGAALAGDGTFPTQPPGSPFILTGSSPSGVAVGEFNRDANRDLALAQSNVRIVLGDGGGTFFTEPAGSPFAANAWDVVVGDFDQDGNEDFATADLSADSVTVRLGAANATFATQPVGSPYAAGDGPISLSLGDFNGDGDDDLAIPNVGSDNVTILLGGAGGTFSQPAGSPVAAGSDPQAVAVGDFDGDGDDDLAIANRGGGVTVRLGAGDGTFATEPAGSPFPSANDPVAIARGDFNRDGDDDLAIGNCGFPATLTIRLGAGDGTFPNQASGSPYTTGHCAVAVTVAELNSDGAEDLVILNQNQGGPGTENPGTVAVRLGAGDGSFPGVPAGTPYGAGNNYFPDEVAVDDFNGDGNQDLGVGATSAGSAVLGVRLGAGVPALAGNLLVNGGAEGAGVARTAAASPTVPGWGTPLLGQMTHVRYSVPGFPQHIDSARWEGGLGFFAGGPGGDSQSVQSVDVSGSAASIDAGLATARLSALLGGYRTDRDRMQASARFFDGAGNPIGSPATIGPVTPGDRNNRTELLPRGVTAPVPAGTRRILVSLVATREDGTYNDGYADNVKLTLNAPAPGGGGTGGGDTGGGDVSGTGSGSNGGGTGGGDDGGRALTRTLSFAYSAKKGRFAGRIGSNEAACLTGRVKVFERVKGKDPKVGSDRTNATGGWSVEEPDPDGKYYASVPASTVPAGTCPLAKSKTKTVD